MGGVTARRVAHASRASTPDRAVCVWISAVHTYLHTYPASDLRIYVGRQLHLFRSTYTSRVVPSFETGVPSLLRDFFLPAGLPPASSSFFGLSGDVGLSHATRGHPRHRGGRGRGPPHGWHRENPGDQRLENPAAIARGCPAQQ